MDMVRLSPDSEPVRSLPGMGDHPSGTGLYAAIVSALYRREKTGKGSVVRSSLLQNGLWANACFVQARLFGESIQLRPLRANAPNALANHYRTRDNRWFILAMHNEQRELSSFLDAIGMADVIQDPRFATSDSRKRNSAALTEKLDAIFASRDLAEWRRILDRAGVTFGIVGTVNEASDDKQFTDIGALVPFADGKGLTISSPFEIDGVEKVAPRRAPKVGQHSAEVLREAGFSEDQISKLRDLGVVA
jgi:formyl-CoA transferase